MSAERQSAPVVAGPPAYFHPIRDGASKRWDQLEADPELAGPWHQLFKPMRSPRHILSELLQNADDAGATEARVSIEGQRFVFEHNGQDFVESYFASICRFGYLKEHCLEREPLWIEADVRGLPGQKPDAYAFILVNVEGEPVEMTGARVRALRDGGEITIYPATYRLVYDLDP